MKALLICPAIRPAVPQLSADRPLVLAPILGECIVSHWIEHLAVLGAREVQVIAADRANQVRTALGDGARWGVKLGVIAANVEPTPTEAFQRYRPDSESNWLPGAKAIVVMDHLPGCADLPLFESYASWFAALVAWMPLALTPARVRVTEISPGIWVGRRAHVSPMATLLAPCWIGDQVFVEPGAIVGPGAIIENRSVVESEASVTQSWVGPDTFVGPMTVVTTSLAWGGSLTNWRSDSSLHVPDPFLMCSLASPARRLAEAPGRMVRTAETRLNWIGAWPAPVARTSDFPPTR